MKPRAAFHLAWIILAVCFANLFVNYSARLGYGVVLPEMIRDLGFSRTDAGSIYNTYLFSYILLTPLAGHLTDRFGARLVITFCSLVLGAGLLLMGRVDSLYLACFAYGVVGLGATGMWTPVITVVQRWFAPHRRGLALGILSTGFGLGFAAMGAAFPWIVRHFTWRHAWYFTGAAALVMVLANGLFLRRDPESTGVRPWGETKTQRHNTPAKGQAAVRYSASEIFRDRVFWMIGISYLLISYSLYGITTFMVDYARYELGLSLEKASSLATVHGIAQVAGVLTVLPLSDYIGRRKTILLSNAFVALAVIGILTQGTSWLMLSLFVALLAVFYGVTFPVYGACAGDYFRKEIMGTVIGAWTPFYGLGAILSHWIGGMLRDAQESYGPAFALDALAAFLAVGFFFFVKPLSKR
ncbi:MAG TPA: MFS transporter [Syntrophales bacterium]|nr:MFS transporter [Syntrophales bacterium]HOX93985.1 MFS transporter [Syntrophales bacterium]HPI57042.1 MFS transporter [Syntrophales bacterium]HPN23828.1 MFS transporter [Syntrophales bacterium]HQM30029.1 MFS transporter [Syntrophales bacterium]